MEVKNTGFDGTKVFLDASISCPGGCASAPTSPAVIRQTRDSFKILIPYPA